jgi:SAM-dependent methyltransferase
MSVLRGMSSSFLALNRAVSRRIGMRLPQKKEDAQVMYLDAVACCLASLSGSALVVDVGGGRECRFARYRRAAAGIRIVAVDVSAEELAENRDVDETRVADVTKDFPFERASVDLVASEAALEHLRDTESFVAHCERAVKPGGMFIGLFSSKHSPHAIANRILPERWSAPLLRALVPGSTGRLGFRAYYDHASAPEMQQLLERHGFSVSEIRVSYYQSPYLEFFVPFFVVSALYELCIRALGLKNLAAYVVVVAERRSD